MKNKRMTFCLFMQIAEDEVTPGWFYRHLLWMEHKSGVRNLKIHIRRGKYVKCSMRFTTIDAFKKMLDCWERFASSENIGHNFTTNVR